MFMSDFQKLKIIEGKFWEVNVHWDQTVPGRVCFWYKKDSKKDFLDLSKEELSEFYELGKKVKKALEKSFKPDLFNYYSLSNATKHLHIHLIPRYSREINLFGLKFKDSSFGKGYERNPNFVVREDILIKIKNEIIKNLNKIPSPKNISKN